MITQAMYIINTLNTINTPKKNADLVHTGYLNR